MRGKKGNQMTYRECSDCGTKLLSNGTCPWCDEESVIFAQAPDYPFSEEFMEKVAEGEERAAGR